MADGGIAAFDTMGSRSSRELNFSNRLGERARMPGGGGGARSTEERPYSDQSHQSARNGHVSNTVPVSPVN